MPMTFSHGVGIYYEVHGGGPGLMFCHGAGSNAATWWQQIPRFSKQFTCITFDHRCFGRSVAPQEAFRPEFFVEDALAVLDAAGCEQAALVCQSLGGITGLRLALHHPQRISAFISCDSPLAIDHPEMNANVLKFLSSVPISEIENRALSAGFVAKNPALALLYAQINNFNPTTHAAGRQAEWKNRIDGLFEGDHLVSMSELARLECPTLFVVGTDDRAVTPEVVRKLSSIVMDSEVLEIGGSGHSPYFEQPDLFNARVMDFLERRVLITQSA